MLDPALLTGASSGSGAKYVDERMVKTKLPLSRPFDIAVWADPSGMKAVVIRDDGGVPTSRIQLVRVMDGTFDPEYLARCIASKHNSRFLSGSVIVRPRLHDFEVPSLHLSEQQELSRVVRHLSDLQDRSQKVTAELTRLSALVIDAMGEGFVRAT